MEVPAAAAAPRAWSGLPSALAAPQLPDLEAEARGRGRPHRADQAPPPRQAGQGDYILELPTRLREHSSQYIQTPGPGRTAPVPPEVYSVRSLQQGGGDSQEQRCSMVFLNLNAEYGLELATDLREVLQCPEKAPTMAWQVGALNKKKALAGAYFVHCETSRRFVESSII